MYNLLMVSAEGYWDTSPKEFDLSRIFEYTSKILVERFGKLEKPSLDELLSLPCLFAYENSVKSAANIGKITGFKKRGKEVRIEFEFDKALPPISSDVIEKLVWELDIGEWELNRTHWAVKDIDLVHEMIKAGVFNEKEVGASRVAARREIADVGMAYEARPTVFRVPKADIETDLVAVMRPFNKKFLGIQASIEQACKKLGLRCLDVGKVWDETEIIQDIFSLIYRAKYVVCDFSERNPNVFYEAGIAHTLGRNVVPIVQNGDDIPFDLQHHRYIKYENDEAGLKMLEDAVSERLKVLVSQKDRK